MLLAMSTALSPCWRRFGLPASTSIFLLGSGVNITHRAAQIGSAKILEARDYPNCQSAGSGERSLQQ